MSFYYQGRKARIAARLPRPEHDIVIEPFAGSMAYSLHWRPLLAIGIELDAVTASIWHRLASMSEKQLRSVRIPDVGQRFTDPWLMLSDQSESAHHSHSRMMSQFMYDRAWTLKRQAIKHHNYMQERVVYHHGDYHQAPDVTACWFIDPPYAGANAYRHSTIDYEELAEWCLSRKGQVIVCERDGDWLPFQSIETWQGQPANGAPNTTVTERVFVR